MFILHTNKLNYMQQMPSEYTEIKALGIIFKAVE